MARTTHKQAGGHCSLYTESASWSIQWRKKLYTPPGWNHTEAKSSLLISSVGWCCFLPSLFTLYLSIWQLICLLQFLLQFFSQPVERTLDLTTSARRGWITLVSAKRIFWQSRLAQLPQTGPRLFRWPMTNVLLEIENIHSRDRYHRSV